MSPRPLHALLVCTLLAATVGCTWFGSRNVATEKKAELSTPLSALAEKGEVEAMRLVADIEVLRAQGVFSDSAANALGATPATQFLAADARGRLRRAEVGEDISTLLDYSAAEALLLKERAIREADATELRRLANYNTAAAADMAAQLRGRRRDAPH